MSIEITNNFVKTVLDLIMGEEPSWEEIRRHDNQICMCCVSQYPCAVVIFEEKQVNVNTFQTIVTQHNSFQLEIKQLKTENKELKSANDLLLSNHENFQKENDHLQSKISKLTNELESSRKELNENILESQTKELDLQEKISSLEFKLSEKTTRVSKLTSDVSKISVSELNASVTKQLEKIENRIASFKSKSIDTKLEKLMKQSSESSIPKSEASKSFHKSNPTKPKVDVPKKVYTGKSSKPFEKKVSQFTNYSLQKGKKYSKKPTFDGTTTSVSFLSFEDNSFFISKAKSQLTNLKWKPIQKSKSTESKSFKYSLSKLFELAPKPISPVVQKVNDFASKNHFSTQSSKIANFSKKKNDFSPLRPQKLFQNETPGFNSKWNAMSIHQIDET